MEQDKKSKENRKIEREIIGIVIFAAILVGVFFVTQELIKWSNQFEYEGLTFTKTTIGEIPVFYYYYTWTDSQGKSYRYNLYLQNDPRTNDISVSGDPIILSNRKVYVTLNTSYLGDCKDSGRAIGDLALFLKDNNFDVEGALMDYNWAAYNDKKHVTCEIKNQSSVIELFRSDSTGIEVNGSCVRIKVGPDCKIFEAVEKFKLESIIQARKTNSNSLDSSFSSQ